MFATSGSSMLAVWGPTLIKKSLYKRTPPLVIKLKTTKISSFMVMAGENGRSTVDHRILMGFDGNFEFSTGGGAISLADMVFGYFDEECGESSSSSSSSSSGSSYNGIDLDEEEEEMNSQNVAETKAFWEEQQQLLHATLSRTTTLESRIREVTKEALNEVSSQGICFCSKPVTGGCRNCMMTKIRDHLQNAGFDSAICKSKWRRSHNIPAGEHTYLDVIEKSSSKKGGDIRVVIDLGFRAEFEIGRASGEYNKLINRLPEVFVGKAERLKTVVKMLCSAAKKCMKQNKMHMGPWRKHKYMQAKWFSTPCERRTVSEALNLPTGFSEYRMSVKPKSSMLNFDLAENKLAAPSSRFQHFTAVVAVV